MLPRPVTHDVRVVGNGIGRDETEDQHCGKQAQQANGYDNSLWRQLHIFYGTWIARGLFSTLDNIATPYSVKAIGA